MLNVYKTTGAMQYANSPTIDQLIESMNDYVDPRADLINFYNLIWNVDTANSQGLNIWGRIVGVSRVIPIPGSETYFGFDNTDSPPDWAPWSQAPFYAGEKTTGGYALNNASFRTLILTKAMANIAATTAPALNALVSNLFPGRGRCYVQDLGDMAMKYVFEFSLSTLEYAILAYSGVLPHPAGVLVSIQVIPTTGYFGFQEQGPTAMPLDYGIFNPGTVPEFNDTLLGFAEAGSLSLPLNYGVLNVP